MTADYRVGDVFDRLAEIPDGSVDLVLTSPPFLALRSYLPADHPDKGKEIGSEPDPAAFIDTLLALTAEWVRVLAPHGSMAVELGDTYSGSSSGGGDLIAGSGSFDGKKIAAAADNGIQSTRRAGKSWPRGKSLALIPELYRIALSYGVHPLTGQPSPAGKLIVRNVVRWHRPNPPVGALGDKYRPSTSDMVIACTSAKRWFDLDAVRTPHADHTLKYNGGTRPHTGERGGQGTVKEMAEGAMSNPAGAPPLDTWTIPTAPYKGSHYATFPPQLCTIPIQSMCPQHVCVTCGEPRRRIVEPTAEYANRPNAGRDFLGTSHDRGKGMSAEAPYRSGSDPSRVGASFTTLDWTDCGHNTWRNGVVLDPFAGSGTTLMVANGNGRDSIGIDIDERNAELAYGRLGMFLTTS